MPDAASSDSISPALIRRLTPTASDFPLPGSQSFATVSKRDQGLVSPAQSIFSFLDDEEPVDAVSSCPSAMDKRIISRPIDRGAPGDKPLIPIVDQSPQQIELAKKKGQFYADLFSYREPNLSPRERIYKDSVITAEVKTNVIINDEYTFLNDLAQHISQRYRRPISSILITLDHSICLMLAGSFESAYTLTVNALPSQLLPTTNKRNAALIQGFMRTSLGVDADRGVIKFVGIPEDCLATNGTTILGQVERLQKSDEEEKRSEAAQEIIERRQSRKQLSMIPSELPLRMRSQPGSRVPSPSLRNPPVPAMPSEKSPMDRKAVIIQKLGKRRSFMARFGK